MRLFTALALLVLLSGFAAGQVAVIGGTAGYWSPAYGVYAAPFVPLVVTPSVTLSTVSPSAAGATNATFGNVAGATNATLSNEFVSSQPAVGVYTQPVWYGPSSETATSGVAMAEGHHMQKAQGLDFGIASWPSSRGAAGLMAGSGAKKASHTYTNQDIDQVNQKTGIVKWDGKTEKL